MPLLQITITPIFEASFVVQLHLLCAVLALASGGVIWWRPKGTKLHKFAGRWFACLMVVTAISAIFIRTVRPGQFSWIHIFVPISLFGLFQSIRYIRNGNVAGHKRAVKGLYFGALLIPGLFTFLHGRLLHAILVGG